MVGVKDPLGLLRRWSVQEIQQFHPSIKPSITVIASKRTVAITNEK